MKTTSANRDSTAEPASQKGRKSRFWRIAGITTGALFFGLVTWIVVLAVQREAEEQPIDKSRTRNVEIASNADRQGTNRQGVDGQGADGQGADGQGGHSGRNGDDAGANPVAQFLAEHATNANDHPLDPLLLLAHSCLEQMRETVSDYEATIIKQERIGDDLGDEQVLAVKIRQGLNLPDEAAIPFSVYIRFLDPSSLRGREVIWVEGANRGRMLAHEGGWKNLATLRLEPSSDLAMMGNRYPVTEIGMEKLLIKLIEIGNRIRDAGDCTVRVDHSMLVNNRPCSLLKIRRHTRTDSDEFYLAEIYIDHETMLPIRYAAYDWPAGVWGNDTIPSESLPAGDWHADDPPLIEMYTYLDLELNVGLDDSAFDPANEAYRFH